MADIDKKLEQEQQEEQKEKTPDVNDLIAELASLKAANAKQKNALDKALKNNGELTKQLRAKMTADEQLEEEKREEEARKQAEMDELKIFRRETLAKERYLAQGMNIETATLAAKAEINGDMDELSSIQKSFQEAQLKQAKAEWMASRPQLNTGMEGECTVTKEQFDRYGYEKRVEFKQKYPEVYKKYTQY